MKEVLLIDNFDSFTYNLVHYLEELDCKVTVVRNDDLDIDLINTFQKIIISPGSGIPNEAGELMNLLTTIYKTKKILGICLGHQALGEIFGANLTNLNSVYHGVSTKVKVLDKNDLLFKNIPDFFNVGRYHSWIIDSKNLPNDLIITSKDENDQIMSFRHFKYPVFGIQFHPESILTEHGKQILSNWLKI
jgi:anthranilate synthase component 2